MHLRGRVDRKKRWKKGQNNDEYQKEMVCTRTLWRLGTFDVVVAVGFTALRASAAENSVQTQASETVTDESTQETTYGAPIAFCTSIQSPQNGDDTLGVLFALPSIYTLVQSGGAQVEVQLDVAAGESMGAADDSVTFVPTVSVALTQATSLYDNPAFVSFADQSVRQVLGDAIKDTRGTDGTYARFEKSDESFSARARFAVTQNDVTVYSAWSDPFTSGAVNTELSDVTQLPSPVVNDAQMIGDDETQERQLTFTLAIDDEIRRGDVYRRRNGAAAILGTAVLSVNGEQTTFIINQDGSPLAGTRYTLQVPVGVIPANAFLSLQVYLSDGETLRSDPSALTSLKIQPADAPQVDIDGVVMTDEDDVVMADENDTQGAKCSVCGICPEPFGIRLFVAAGVIVGLILIISVLTHLRRLLQRKECPRCHKKCKQQEKQCPVCHYRFTTIMPLTADDENTTASKQEKSTLRSRNKK